MVLWEAASRRAADASFMIQLILVSIIIALLWMFMARRQQNVIQQQANQEMTHLEQRAQTDIQRAKAAADTANKKIQEDMKELNRGMKQSE